MNDFGEELTLDMIPEGIYREIAEAIGVHSLLKLSGIVGGTTFYLPKSESLLRPVRDAHIKEEFNGSNHATLAVKYNVTERWVRALCGVGCVEGQLDLEDMLDGVS